MAEVQFPPDGGFEIFLLAVNLLSLWLEMELLGRLVNYVFYGQAFGYRLWYTSVGDCGH